MPLESDLLDWYDVHRRYLPWREDPTPYHVYLSEIMLQQTQVETVKPYYQRFLSAYPTLEDLAQAKEEDVLKLWEGLGYYSRGRHLHEASQVIVKDFQGQIPVTRKDLLSLPGIGNYTASAILAIAYHQKAIAVDGNLIRVYSRLTETKEESPDALKEGCEAYFKSQLHLTDPSHFNQALMDLGEMVCLPHQLPLCDQCPFKGICQAFKHQTMLDYPPAKKAKEKTTQEKTVLVVTCQNKVAIQKRDSDGLLASLYEFILLDRKCLATEIPAELAKLTIAASSLEPLGAHKHVFSHLIWKMTGYLIKTDQEIKIPGILWVTPEELVSSYPMPNAFAPYKEACLAFLTQNGLKK
jgi:A/G-specific adenine glycosylase